MSKGSGVCQRPAVSLEAGERAKNEPHSEIHATLKLQRAQHHCWWTKDGRATFWKRKEGWEALAISDPVCKAFREYGLTSSIEGEHTCFPSLKAARQAVSDVSLEAGLNIDLGLTRGKYVSYKIGDLPLNIRRDEGLWWVACHPLVLSQSLQKYFNTTPEFVATWQSADIALAQYPTRKAAHQAVINWLNQTIIEGK